MNKYKTEKDEASGLLRVVALIDIPYWNVTAGDRGGLIETEANLSQAGNCWVAGNARVTENACVRGNAWVTGNAWAYGNAQVFESAQVFGNARVFGNAWVYSYAKVHGDAKVSGNAHVYEDERVLTVTAHDDGARELSPAPKGKLVTPQTYFVGATAANFAELLRYLKDTDQVEFVEAIAGAKSQGLSDGEILISYYAKLCYAALTTKKNENISRVRDIHDNLIGVIASMHGSCWEHCYLNFTITNCSRVLTHEICRHRVGTSFSQSSGRYIRSDKLDLVIDPILDPINTQVLELQAVLEGWYEGAVKAMGLADPTLPFDTKKKITSALRRLLPNGQANEIGFGVNLRSLRNILVLRTSRHAEWEIRLVFNQIADLVRDKYPTLFEDETRVLIDGLHEITFTTDKL